MLLEHSTVGWNDEADESAQLEPLLITRGRMFYFILENADLLKKFAAFFKTRLHFFLNYALSQFYNKDNLLIKLVIQI